MAVVGHTSSVACPRLAGITWEQVRTDSRPASEDLLTADSSRCKGLLTAHGLKAELAKLGSDTCKCSLDKLLFKVWLHKNTLKLSMM